MLSTETAIAVQETQYIFPPRPQDAIPRSEADIFTEIGWRPQLKYNDSRCMVKYLPDGTIELWNRHGERFRTYHMPDWLEDQLAEVKVLLGLRDGEYHLLDGGLLDQKHRAIKDTIVIWDVLVENGQHLLGTTYVARHDRLITSISSEETFWYNSDHHDPIDFGIKLDGNVLLARYYKADDVAKIWDTVDTINAPFTVDGNLKPVLEGVVYKDPDGKLDMGYQEKNNGDWMVRSRVKTGRHRF